MQEQNLPKPITPEANDTPAVESAPAVSSYEQSPNTAISPEVTPAAGDSVNQSSSTQKLAPVDLPQPIVQQTPPPMSTSNTDPDLPVVADDVDVIEKVWVDKAKSIVKQTRDDPYMQEQQVSSLQEDYQKKRYGKDKPNR